VDDTAPELLDLEITRERVTSLDEVINVLRTHVRITPARRSML
jgi:hypothetical protein